MTDDRRSRAVASLRGLAVGDAAGSRFFMPETLPALEARRLPPEPWLWTDDTEMACSVLAVLDRHGRVDQDALAASFAEHHDFDRGYGPGVNRMLRLIRQEGGDWRVLAAQAWDGRGSWGNGAAMRVAPLGAYFADDLDAVAGQAAASAEVTHTHPEGVAGAIAVALAAALLAADPEIAGARLLDAVAERTPPGLVRDGIRTAVSLLPLSDPRSAAATLGNGHEVSAQDTVPFCLWVAAKHPNDYAEAFWATAAAGGDIDTTCAIVGGIVAARTGLAGIPSDWLEHCEPLPDWARVEPRGSGPGAITPDGCAVDLYRRLPSRGESEIVHAAVPAKASIIELGCGTGRISTLLAHLGHRVVGVDESPEMLAACKDIETVRSSVEELDLGERFDVVLMASHLVNASESQRTKLLESARRHLAPGGTLVLQRHRPGWVRTVKDTVHDDGVMRSTLTVLGRPSPDSVRARIRYEFEDAAWEQEFTTFDIDDAALPETLAAAGLRLGRMLTAEGDWFTAVNHADPPTAD
ncbi:MAG TPA: ADP-ribosylglycohydrolase family protein [Actinospica sp.]|nr:ADP-ribosylglycohydrolase family protein [Actinospica sp.]